MGVPFAHVAKRGSRWLPSQDVLQFALSVGVSTFVVAGRSQAISDFHETRNVDTVLCPVTQEDAPGLIGKGVLGELLSV
jgi:hypothetical protein